MIGEIAGFAVLTWFASAKVLPAAIDVLQRLLHVSELSFGLLIGTLFLVVAGAERIGLHGSLGALLFGASLSGLPSRMRRDIMPGMRSVADGLFVPLLFASAGLYLDWSFTALPAGTILAVVFIPMAGKVAGALAGTYLARLDTPVVLATGLMAKGVAEIALLLVLLETGVITREVFSLLACIMFAYILVMPSVIGFVTGRAKDPDRAKPPAAVPPSFARHALEGVPVSSVMDRTRVYPASRIVGERLPGNMDRPRSAGLHRRRRRRSRGRRVAGKTAPSGQAFSGGYSTGKAAAPQHAASLARRAG